MKCPRRCGVELREITLPDLGGARIHMCRSCEGTWYPGEALSAVGQSSKEVLEGTELSASMVADKLEKIDLEADIECPICDQTMSRFSYSLAPEIKIDECLEHGTWLDDGELGAIVEAVAGSKAEMTEYRAQILKTRQEMNIDGVAKGGAIINPFALTLRILNAMFVRKPKA